MSDALSDIARDEERGRMFEKFAEVLVLRLREEVDFDTLIVAARDVDAVRGGYWGRGTKLEDQIRSEFFVLRLYGESNGDPFVAQQWLRWLYKLSDTRHYLALKRLSPFKDKVLVFKRGRVYDMADVEAEQWETRSFPRSDFAALVLDGPGTVVELEKM
jgi:hypothetical protein